MKLIIGLGNPVEQYTNTRHNLGFEVVDKLVGRLQEAELNWENNSKMKSLIYKLPTENLLLILAKPQTYMNRSGLAVVLLASYYKIAPEDIIIIHDELDLPLGQIKIRLGGAGAGHHGVESVINSLNSDKFVRVRLGIGNQQTKLGEHKKVSFSAEHFVLEPFMSREKSKVKSMIKRAVEAIEILIKEGLEKAQNQYN